MNVLSVRDFQPFRRHDEPPFGRGRLPGGLPCWRKPCSAEPRNANAVFGSGSCSICALATSAFACVRHWYPKHYNLKFESAAEWSILAVPKTSR
jgi:hypothetical protein